MSQTEILLERRGAAGVATLNRPNALNALTPVMVRALAQALDEWERDASISRIVICGAGGRAFCAGGDIRDIYEWGLAGEYAKQREFWREEYQLNQTIARYSKPYIALVDGFDLGGGMGVSMLGSHRIAGERAQFAMPEVTIGFTPDVGATWFLPRLPGKAGVWMALTGARIGAGDACALGIATHHVASARFAELASALESTGDVDATIADYARLAPPAKHADDSAVIADCFSRQSVAAVMQALASAGEGGSAFAMDALAVMRAKSPTSMSLALRQMQLGAGLTIEEALRVEFRVASRICLGKDIYEGVRSVIIDKDQSPKWSPASVEEIDPQAIEAHFASLGADELVFAARGGA